jgi:hypothetical protein
MGDVDAGRGRLTVGDVLADLAGIDDAPTPARALALDAVGRADCVAAAAHLVARLADARRLNEERVAPADVALVLPSDRHYPATDTPASRTDLLHANVARLQSRTDAWIDALNTALVRLDTQASPNPLRSSPPTSPAWHHPPPRADTPQDRLPPNLAPATPPLKGTAMAQPAELELQPEPQPEPKLETELKPEPAPDPELDSHLSTTRPADAADEFEDDDPWSELS